MKIQINNLTVLLTVFQSAIGDTIGRSHNVFVVLTRIARLCSNVSDFYNRNQILTAKL